MVAITFVGFGAWAVSTPLARGAHVAGKVVVDTNRKKVQHLEGGIVKDLLVREGERVTQGQALIRLDPTQVRARRDILRDRWLREKMLETRLEAEVAEATTLSIPDALRVFSENANYAEALQDQQALLAARREELSSEIQILQDKIRQFHHQIAGMRAQVTSNRRQQALIEEELTGMRELLADGHIPLNQVRQYERESARLEGENGQLLAEIARAEVAVGEVELQVIRTRQGFRRQVLDELREVRGQLSELEEQIVGAEDVLKRTEIQAPVAGQVVGLAVHTVGGVIAPGETVLEIVPADDKLIFEGRVNPLDGDVVYPGMQAEVRLLGLPRKSAPLLRAHVLTLSADTLTDPATGASYYLARIQVDDDELARIADEHVLVPGMPADVLLKAGERTPFEYMLSPFIDLFRRAMREQ